MKSCMIDQSSFQWNVWVNGFAMTSECMTRKVFRIQKNRIYANIIFRASTLHRRSTKQKQPSLQLCNRAIGWAVFTPVSLLRKASRFS